MISPELDISAVVSGAFTRAQRAKIDSLREVILGEMKQEGGIGAFEENCNDEEDGNDNDRTVVEVAARINKLPTEQLRILVTKHHLLEAARASHPVCVRRRAKALRKACTAI